MKKTYVVMQENKNSNEDPIELKMGDVVKLGEKSNDTETWANWIYCTSHRTQKAGWTPIQILKIDGESAVATTDYIATEMTVSIGDILIGSNELNGWVWCVREADAESGWVPLNCLKNA